MKYFYVALAAQSHSRQHAFIQKSATNMTTGSFCTLLLGTILVLCSSCDNLKNPATVSFPTITVSKVTFAKSETDLVLKANNSTFGSIVDAIRSHLGKKVVQYYLYNTFDPDLMDRFNAKYNTTNVEILDAVYKHPLPNRFLAGFVPFLIENRGHFMIENIIEDGFNDFFFNHIYKYRESWIMPIHFIGSVAFGFKDVLKDMCNAYELELGRVLKNPMDGLVKYHRENRS